MGVMGMSQISISPAAGSYDGLDQRPREAARLAEAGVVARGGEGGAGLPEERFRVRVAGLVPRMVAGFPVEGPGVRLPRQVLENTLELAGELTVRHARVFSERVNPELAEAGIEILRWKELSASERDGLSELFRQRIYPVLTPLVVDPAHPFPFISGLSLNLAVMITDPRTDASMFARVNVPPLLPRFLAVSQYRFVPIEDVIAAHLGD